MIDLEKITSPDFVKKLSIKELEQLSTQIREFLIENISVTGGHLSSNLGIVELTIALHYVFDSPFDKLIFDVGHQGYTHKILTGRAKDFKTLRQKDGLSGFFKYDESEHDIWEAGHSSTSISAASGFLEAKSVGANIGEVVAIIGDGSIQNGLSLSGINYLGSRKDQKVIIILNDNNMSISKNVGSLGKLFDKIRIQKSYRLLKSITPRFIKNMFRNAKGAISSYFHGNSIMSSVGFRYFGPINGHKYSDLIKFLEAAKHSKESIIIHVKTNKGKGYKYAEQDELGIWHGPGPFKIESGDFIKNCDKTKISWSNGIGNIILEEAVKNKNIKVITPAMVQGSGLNRLQNELPNQLLDVGIAEEHSVVMASAMARNGVIPIVSIYSTFLQRAYDQINHDVARTNTHVVFLIDRSGIVGNDGPTHQGIFDISFLTPLPNVVVAMPKDLNEAAYLINYAIYNYNGPFFIRYPRGNTKIYNGIPTEIEFGSWTIELPIKDINIITYGPVVNKFKEKIEKENLNFGLINANYIKPFDKDLLNSLDGKKLIVYEEVVKNGSLASIIINEKEEKRLNIYVEAYNIGDKYVEQGNIEEVKKSIGLDIDNILEKYKE